ncbi:membrane protein FAM174A-like [Penaeus chinensis]|uniref:membrane protein FAM174A-like n=1 Tax=Penaeus chinensis TaxID=139456 RepID=UPI001FB64B43|nr:membrane protein FAM174A-like [Penaeus chinensis]
MNNSSISETPASAEMRGREHSVKTRNLTSSLGLRDLRLSKIIVCVVLVSILVGVEAASIPSFHSSSSEESNYSGDSSSVVERAAAAPDTQPEQDARVKTENTSSSVLKETATQKSLSAQASDPEKKSQTAGPEEASSEEKDTPEVPEVTESKSDKVDKPDSKEIGDENEEDASTGDEMDEAHLPMAGLKGLSYDAILRGFYVFVGIGAIVLLYIVIKLVRLRRRRATRKYRVLPQHSDDQEMFPLAADDGDDEEIYNAADHQTVK